MYIKKKREGGEEKNDKIIFPVRRQSLTKPRRRAAVAPPFFFPNSLHLTPSLTASCTAPVSRWTYYLYNNTMRVDGQSKNEKKKTNDIIFEQFPVYVIVVVTLFIHIYVTAQT